MAEGAVVNVEAYDIKPDAMYDESGTPVALFSKGHHGDFDQVAERLNQEFVAHVDDVSIREGAEPRYEWWRCVPVAPWDEPPSGHYLLSAKPHSRGAFPVTVFYLD